MRLMDYEHLTPDFEGTAGYASPPDDLYLLVGRVSVTRAYEL
ncbi:hypothetical protein [Nocardiopsis sp. CNR-923]|nr:hypothetical protein [Nocardiopsis sp. CNR-923]